ncbi:MAG: ATP-binding cassette domain-containing protein [Treponema sp.]|nr:ATP-binding cassette domain-containing protein [Treponema sp.]
MTKSGDKAVITVNNLSYSYDSKKALDRVSFCLEPSSYTAIVGSNGSGKSTLCRLICGLIENQEGEILIEQGKRIGLVFQSPKDQIVSGKVYRDTAFGPQNLKLTPDEVELRTIECLSVVELLHKAEAPSNALSLGQTQKLAFAGMLAVSPDILILDEATAMLDPSSRENIYEILRSFNRRGSTIIHITHDLDAVKEASDVIGLEEGRIFFNGTSAEFFKKPELVRKIRGELLKKAEKKDLSGREVSFSFDNISFAYANKHDDENAFLLNNISFSLYKGTLSALTGPSGAGKSTLLELGAGLLEPSGGSVLCNQKPVLAQQNCAAALFEAFASDDVAFGPRNDGVKGHALVERVKESMDKAGLPFSLYGERQSAGLSGGEQRRLAIAGILAMNRDIVFFDEPTAGLDGISRSRVMTMLRSLADEGKTVLFTTHHQDEADFADREIKLENGNVQPSAVPEPVEGPTSGVDELVEPLRPYDSTSLLKGLKSFSTGLSGSGWKTKCRLEKVPAFLRILLFLVLFVLSLVFKKTVACGCMVAVSIIYCLFANFSFKKIIKSVFKLLPFLCFFAVFQLVFRPALPDEVRYTTWRFLTITPSKLLFCLNSILRTYASLLCVCAFFVSTPEYDLIDGLKKLLPFKSLILIMELIFRFIPLLVDEAADIIKTQIIRGGLGKVKGKLARIKAVVPLIVPLVIRTVKRSEILADAIVMRCFNGK